MDTPVPHELEDPLFEMIIRSSIDTEDQRPGEESTLYTFLGKIDRYFTCRI